MNYLKLFSTKYQLTKFATLTDLTTFISDSSPSPLQTSPHIWKSLIKCYIYFHKIECSVSESTEIKQLRTE